MSSTEIVDFSVKLSSIWWDKIPHAIIRVDDELIVEGDIAKEYEKESETFKFQKELSEGKHTLSIEFSNKTNDDTLLENGKIVKDMLLSMDEILIDDIELGYLAVTSNKFYVNKDIRPEQPDIIEKMPPLSGFAGKWEIEFSCPTYIWFLENL